MGRSPGSWYDSSIHLSYKLVHSLIHSFIHSIYQLLACSIFYLFEGYGGYSLINPEKVDLVKFPNILDIPKWYYTEINAGDCLYLPSQMWHVVHSFGDQNLAVAFLLSQFNERNIENIDFADCGDTVPNNNVTLDQVF